MLPLVWVSVVENRWWSPAVPATREAVVGVVHWNIWYATLGWERIEREVLRESGADFYAFSELPEEANLTGVAQRLGTEFTVLRQGSMGVIARGRLSAGSAVPFVASPGRGLLLEWESRQGRLRVLIADLPSSIRIPHGPVLRELCHHIDRLQPDLVLGDLNAPRRSQALAHLPAGYVHAYDAAGSGWSYTWPVGCPVMGDRSVHRRAPRSGAGLPTQVHYGQRPPSPAVGLCGAHAERHYGPRRASLRSTSTPRCSADRRPRTKCGSACPGG